MRKKVYYTADLLRVKQWVKNVFIFFPILYAGHIFELMRIQDCLLTFLAFCLTASGLYMLNDFRDMEKDRHHPRKSQRPLARGDANHTLVICLIICFIFIGLWVSSLVSRSVTYITAIYIAIHLIYNFFTKKIVILDVIFIAVGFQIRIWAGAFAAGVFPSLWLQMCVFLLALFLGFTKRRYEISTLKEKAAEHRRVLSHYTSYLLDQIIIICSTLAIAFYGLYAISSDIVDRVGNQNMIYSIIFVIYGIFRYLYLIHVKKFGDDPGEILASDMPLLFNVILWILYCGALIYWPK